MTKREKENVSNNELTLTAAKLHIFFELMTILVNAILLLDVKAFTVKSVERKNNRQTLVVYKT